jgi:GT2 family glycosyltransferase
MFDLSIVTINHHHRGIIENCIESLHALPDKATFELLVVDNTPEDGLAAWVRAHFSGVAVVSNETPHGYASNANRGMLSAVRGRYAMMLNPDVVCRPGLLDEMVRFMDRNPQVGMAAPKLVNEDGTLQPSCRRFPKIETLALRFLRFDGFLKNLRVLREYLMADWDHASESDVDWVTGAVAVFRREALRDAAMMDESYYMYWEDLDLCLRLWHLGWRVAYVPQACAVHAHMRQGVKHPFSKFARGQLTGALSIFRKFGLQLRRSSGRRAS